MANSKKSPFQYYLVVKKTRSDLVIDKARGYNKIMKNEDKIDILMEYLDEKFELIEENFKSNRFDTNELKKDVAEIKESIKDISVMKNVTKDHSRQLQEHERRIDFVEKQVA